MKEGKRWKHDAWPTKEKKRKPFNLDDKRNISLMEEQNAKERKREGKWWNDDTITKKERKQMRSVKLIWRTKKLSNDREQDEQRCDLRTENHELGNEQRRKKENKANTI